MKSNDVILKFDTVCSRDKYGIRTLTGAVTASSVLKLFDVADLKANPREARRGKVTEDIIESIVRAPELFHFKTKGLLISASACTPLDRNRFRLEFEDPDFEGVLDGGHNMLAIATHMISAASSDGQKKLRGKSRWDDVRAVWHEMRDDIESVKELFDFLIPIEILYPQEGKEGHDEFENSILEIAQARNNNAELRKETKAHKKGLYDVIKECLDRNLVGQVEWKTNDGGRIKSRDIVALALIPLTKLPDRDKLPGLKDFRPVSLYRYKTGCVDNFTALMESPDVSARVKGDMRELKHEGVRSALGLLRDLPALVDQVYLELPEAYNQVSPGFGRISAVRLYDEENINSNTSKYLRHPPKSKYYQQDAKYDVPEGFILPIIWGMSELMEYSDGEVKWMVDPYKFLKVHLKDIMNVYHGIISLSKYDPQNVAKVAASYELVASHIRALAREAKAMAA